MKNEENTIKPRRYRPNQGKYLARVRAWSLQRRIAQRKRILKTKPWRHATGPRSASGKAKIRYNALKHGFYGATWRSIKTSLRKWRQLLLHTGDTHFFLKSVCPQTPQTPHRTIANC